MKSFEEVADQRNKLKHKNHPVLILRGQCDNQKWGFTKEYLDLLPNVRLEIMANRGHDLTAGSLGPYLKLIEDFLGSQRAMKPQKRDIGSHDTH